MVVKNRELMTLNEDINGKYRELQQEKTEQVQSLKQQIEELKAERNQLNAKQTDESAVSQKSKEQYQKQIN